MGRALRPPPSEAPPGAGGRDGPSSSSDESNRSEVLVFLSGLRNVGVVPGAFLSPSSSSSFPSPPSPHPSASPSDSSPPFGSRNLSSGSLTFSISLSRFRRRPDAALGSLSTSAGRFPIMSESSSELLSSIPSSSISSASSGRFRRPRRCWALDAASSPAAAGAGLRRRPRFRGGGPSSSSSSSPFASAPAAASPGPTSFSLSLDAAAGFRPSSPSSAPSPVSPPSSSSSSSPRTAAPYPTLASLGTGNASPFHLLMSPRNLDWNLARSNSDSFSSCIFRRAGWLLRCRPPYRVARWMESLLSRRERRMALCRLPSGASPKCSSIAASNAAMPSLGTATVSSLPRPSPAIARWK